MYNEELLVLFSFSSLPSDAKITDEFVAAGSEKPAEFTNLFQFEDSVVSLVCCLCVISTRINLKSTCFSETLVSHRAAKFPGSFFFVFNLFHHQVSYSKKKKLPLSILYFIECLPNQKL